MRAYSSKALSLLCLVFTTHIIFAKSPVSIFNNSFQYSDEYTDQESDLQYLNARYYDPKIPRFIQWDTYDLANRYGYAPDGNPVMDEDPSGHCIFGNAIEKNLFVDALDTVTPIVRDNIPAAIATNAVSISRETEPVRITNLTDKLAYGVFDGEKIETIYPFGQITLKKAKTEVKVNTLLNLFYKGESLPNTAIMRKIGTINATPQEAESFIRLYRNNNRSFYRTYVRMSGSEREQVNIPVDLNNLLSSSKLRLERSPYEDTDPDIQVYKATLSRIRSRNPIVIDGHISIVFHSTPASLGGSIYYIKRLEFQLPNENAIIFPYDP